LLFDLQLSDRRHAISIQETRNYPCAVSIHWRIRCHMNTVHKTDSVLPSDSMLIFSHSGHTALTQGMIRDSRSVSVVDRLSVPPVTSTDA